MNAIEQLRQKHLKRLAWEREQEREAQEQEAERSREFDDHGRMRVRPYNPGMEKIREGLPKWDPRRHWDIDIGKGFTPIYHEVLEQLAHAHLTGPDYAILLVVIRKILGWRGKFQDRISITQFMTHTGLDKRTIQASLDRLRRINVLLKLSEPTARTATTWALNRQTRNWPVRQAKPPSKSPASVRYINAARRDGKIAPVGVRIVPRTIDKEQYKLKETKEGNHFQTATARRFKLKVIRKER
ncbi:MAG: hypothetical protein A2X35_09265 [Elusimicrobia bacterium GWA2_61_42]|nr:MAG: hypothetical protein A2X35_09265 [Elusimicrobia bacterium GWA2_61_42]